MVIILWRELGDDQITMQMSANFCLSAMKKCRVLTKMGYRTFDLVGLEDMAREGIL